MPDETPVSETSGASATAEPGVPTCGLIMPIAGFGDYSAEHWAHVRMIVERSIREAGMSPQPVWENSATDIISSRISENIATNPYIVCDVSGLNPNVMFEVGQRLPYRKPFILIADSATAPVLPFDLRGIEHMFYPRDLSFPKIETFIADLAARLVSLQQSVEGGTYRSILESLGPIDVVSPGTRETDASTVIIARLDDITRQLAALKKEAKLTPEPLRSFGPIALHQSREGSVAIVADAQSLDRVLTSLQHDARFKGLQYGSYKGDLCLKFLPDRALDTGAIATLGTALGEIGSIEIA